MPASSAPPRAQNPKAAASPEDCADALLEFLPAFVRLMVAEVRHGAGPNSLTPPQFRCLEILRREPGLSLSALAERLGVRQPTASLIVVRLVRDGLVGRGRAAGERRRVVLTLTDKGRNLLEAMRVAIRERIAIALGPLPAAQRARVAQGLEILTAAIAGPEPSSS